jgi:glycosyltransferase involved in cell wall biosynthesis
VRIVLNTRSDTAGAQASIVGLAHRLRAAGVDATLNDWHAYERYDVAIFLGYDHELEAARRANPGIRVGLSDPKQSRPQWVDAARAADFLLVSSVEQREAFLRLNRNIHVLFMFPPVPLAPRTHEPGERLVVAYHGNRVHLEAMGGTGVRAALEELGRTRPVELVAVYNVAAHGRAVLGMPDPRLVDVRHVQLQPATAEDGSVSPTIVEELSRADIGIVPSLLPVHGAADALRATASLEPSLAYEPFDHLLRFKASSNPGRLYPFARLGVPVVADPTPSLAQFVLDGVSGFLAGSARGWYEALERLAGDPALRAATAAELRARLDDAYERQVGDLMAFLGRAPLGPPPALAGERSAEADLAELPLYAAPSSAPRRERLRARLHRLRRR